MKMVDQRVDLQGRILFAQLDRIQDHLLDNSGELSVQISFAKDEIGIRFIAGAIQAKVALQCQRCLEPVQVEIDSTFTLGIVFSEDAAKNLPAYYEPLLLQEPELDLWQMAEEELILSLPIAAAHPEGECTCTTVFGEYTGAAEGNEEKAPNPFQVLQQLKDKE